MSDTSPFIDRVWVLTAIDSEPIDRAAGRAPDVQFGGDGRLSGFAGVNRLMGSWHVDDGVLTIEGPATTMMAGPPPAMALEQQFLRALGTAGTLHHDGDRLTIGDRLSFGAEDEAPAERHPVLGDDGVGPVAVRLQRVERAPDAG
jgi:heat shock protein HslJ